MLLVLSSLGVGERNDLVRVVMKAIQPERGISWTVYWNGRDVVVNEIAVSNSTCPGVDDHVTTVRELLPRKCHFIYSTM